MSSPNANLPTDLMASLPAFSFVYDGRPSVELLSAWKHQDSTKKLSDGRTQQITTWQDPNSDLEIVCEATHFPKSKALEWIVYFRNTGTSATPILEQIKVLDTSFASPAGEVHLHHSKGSECTEDDFLPLIDNIAPGGQFALAPLGGRGSSGCLPFFNLEWNGGGVVGAIGWSGQWELKLNRDAQQQLTLQAGQQTTHLSLLPGELIRTPRMLLVPWEGADRLQGHNSLRKLLVDYYLPQINGQLAIPPVSGITWFYFNEGNEVTEANQLAVMPSMAEVGMETFWMDAGWFEGGWPNGAGSWVPKPEAFPRGLKPLGDAAHAKGLKFVLWFEPERITPISRIFKEHPELTEGVENHDGLLRLQDPNAAKWITDYLSQCISDWGIDVLRIDYNIDPLGFWHNADAPDRQGATENHYIQNLYKMWDDLRARHPGLTIDNCSSGGRRIDLETISRSYPLWQSDLQCGGRPRPIAEQVQNAGLSLYVPLHSGGVWSFDPYEFRSAVTAGIAVCIDLSKDTSLKPAASKMIAELKSLRPYYAGDYYPLTDITTAADAWCAWQYNRPDMGEGFVMCFRRPEAAQDCLKVNLHGLDAKATYCLTDIDTGKTTEMKGSDLAAGYTVTIANQPGSVLLKYHKVSSGSK
jgi:alpha-galactosidase